ncbi:putative F-box protein At2g02030 [Phragmites australis]|uniref:putative F-box protein At2g02030 n=1 Tax=Phragmites australis TaxID=29695 RepID=UPI002D77A9F4|nr:putative F-box protein At2g02030 [Phragmites australis]
MTTPERPEKRRRVTPSRAATAATIPDELLISEVLLRLPVKSLARFKSVCRSWRAAVEDAAFVRRHLELSRARPPTMLVIPREGYHYDDGAESGVISFHRLLLGEARAPGTADVELVFEKAWPEGITHSIVPTHCDGLVAVATTTGEIFVCNPATREFVALPPGSTEINNIRAPAAALGYDAWRKVYVVSRYFYRKYDEFMDVETGAHWLEYDIGHEIFTLGGDSWEPTADPPHAIGPARPICTREAFYCCTSNLRPNALLRFSLRDRAFDVVPSPPGTDFVHAVDHLTELDGKLCYVHTVTETAFDVWLAEDGPTRPKWSLRCRIDFGDFGPSIGSEALFPVAAAGNEMLVAADYKKLYSYDERYKFLREAADMEEELAYERPNGSTFAGELVHHVVPYVESLVSISTRN